MCLVDRRAGPLERVEVAQAAAAVLQIGLEHLGDRAGPRQSQVGCVRELADEPVSALACQHAPALGDLGREAGIAGDVADLEDRRQRVEVALGELEGVADRARRVSEHEAGVPHRVPEVLGDLAQVGLPGSQAPAPGRVVGQQHDVDVGTRAELAARVRPERHDGDRHGRCTSRQQLREGAVEKPRERVAEVPPAERCVPDQRGARCTESVCAFAGRLGVLCQIASVPASPVRIR